MGSTNIRWTDKTWNPARGCTLVSSGCTHCYAAETAARRDYPGSPFEGYAKRAPSGNAYFTGRVEPMWHKIKEPLAWERKAADTGERIMVFVNSMSDLFHDALTNEFLDTVFSVMEQCPHVTFQILTKRPKRMQQYISDRWAGGVSYLGPDTAPLKWIGHGYYPSNIWLGVSTEDQRRANERIPLLIETPAAVRFLSVEPMLAPVDLKHWLQHYEPWYGAGGAAYMRGPINRGIHWVIVGGESGAKRRPMEIQWARDVRDQCTEAHVAFFFKQISAFKSETLPYLDGFKWEQFPDTPLVEQPPTPYGSCAGERIIEAFPGQPVLV